ncbi:MAG: AraC family transcriptional regulator [Cytophagales bacterium]|nr:AraC family transcriptional regulator [Cytophagales bacterium]
MTGNHATGRLFAAEGALGQVLRHFYAIRTPPEGQTQVQHLSPHYDMMLVFNFGPPVRISFHQEAFDEREVRQTAVIGPLRKLLNYELKPGSDLVAAVFTLDGFYRLFQVPLPELPGQAWLDPDGLPGQDSFNPLWETLRELDALPERIGFLNAYLAAFVQQSDEASLPLLDAIPYFRNPAVNPAKAVALDHQLSDRTVQLRFQKYLGFSPKEMIRFVRFKQVLYRLVQQPGKPVDWHELVIGFGYHDQSHLIKDFGHFLGTTPQKFVKSYADYCIAQPARQYLDPPLPPQENAPFGPDAGT